MKKNFKFLFTVLAIIPLFISCSGDDDDPVRIGAATITFDNKSEIVITDGILPEAITGSIVAPTGAEIESIEIVLYYSEGDQKNNVTIAERENLTEESGSKKGKYTFRFDQSNSAISKYINTIQSLKITTKVKNGEISTKELTFKHENTPEVEYLSEPEDFEWKRVGASAGTGLETFGLTWTSNTSAAAIIKTDDKTKMVKLTAADWSNIETKEQLKEAVDKGTDIDQYSGVSATEASKTYDDVLAVNVKGEGVYYLIHITNSTVDSDTSGTTITIKGESKN